MLCQEKKSGGGVGGGGEVSGRKVADVLTCARVPENGRRVAVAPEKRRRTRSLHARHLRRPRDAPKKGGRVLNTPYSGRRRPRGDQEAVAGKGKGRHSPQDRLSP